MRRDGQDLTGGLVLLALGLAGIAGALQHDLGSARMMGPGYFPLLAASGVAVSGLILAVLGAVERRPHPRPDWGSLAAVTVAGAVFAAAMARLGLVPAILACVVVATLADRRLRWHQVALMAVLLAAAAHLVFVLLLGLPLPLMRWPRWS